MCSRTLINKTTSVDANRAGHSRKMIREVASSNTYPEMSDSASKHRKIYVDNHKYRYKPKCIIHDPVNSSNE